MYTEYVLGLKWHLMINITHILRYNYLLLITFDHHALHFPSQGVDSQVVQAISVVPEEKVIFGLNATAISHLTLNKIRKMYSKVDNKAIAKQVCSSTSLPHALPT